MVHRNPRRSSSFASFNLQGMVDNMEKDNKELASDSSDCIDKCVGQTGKAACKKCDDIREKSEEKLGPGNSDPEMPAGNPDETGDPQPKPPPDDTT